MRTSLVSGNDASCKLVITCLIKMPMYVWYLGHHNMRYTPGVCRGWAQRTIIRGVFSGTRASYMLNLRTGPYRARNAEHYTVQLGKERVFKCGKLIYGHIPSTNYSSASPPRVRLHKYNSGGSNCNAE
jgi:hypothetical protein